MVEKYLTQLQLIINVHVSTTMVAKQYEEFAMQNYQHFVLKQVEGQTDRLNVLAGV